MSWTSWWGEFRSKQQGPAGPLPAGKMLQRQCDCGQHSAGGECGKCRQKREPSLQRASERAASAGTAPPIVNDVISSPGQPLDKSTRTFMESRFGHDFSRVRVHTDGKASDSARSVDALAYTVGSHIAFAKDRFSPSTGAGKQLLAHELMHVVQQGQSGAAVPPQTKLEISGPGDSAEQEADAMARRIVDGGSRTQSETDHRAAASGKVQRTPAPPSYKTVTGVKDLSRIRMDAVPDFPASSLTSPIEVTPYVTDSSVVHISWEFYDPTDKLMHGSYSASSTSATAKTSTFKIQPSHFAGSFIEGKYILRLVGRNASHEPIVYSDRDFYVLKSDLTTGTAQATTYGDITFTKYGKTDANPPSSPKFSLDVKIQFLPKSTVTCDDVTFIQTAQAVDLTGKSRLPNAGVEYAARATGDAWTVDQTDDVPSPYYIVGMDTSNKPVDTAKFGKKGSGGATPGEATLIDQPMSAAAGARKFETCALCRSGTNRGQIYGCATWGYKADTAGKVTLMPRSSRQWPSDQFLQATDGWNTRRATKPAASRPDEIPSLKKP